ncbi:dihydroxyacetone kinase subunit DhaK [Rhizobium sp. P40RR-XXII]|uniref:dihydroxyacetone kinase family protein n=1 Tax=Rhizobium sp. P40RR-XXII TaxID=2726739 RepID=UPI00145790FB|nr:dihydroxyacetone kinase family protein [Rhizobium sp. P40RR-XXII]NLS21064.1 dihydroxyacetone kinase subunit DhaK [Rhizobium sp. P40RR-XXII]
MKKLINRPIDVVREMLEGIVALAPGLALLDTENVVVRADLPAVAERPVALISGGGAGHEPAHAGYVGPGMLTAAVTGEVFTSPSVDAVLAAIRASAGPAGALLIVKNYTGDRLNFGLAGELAAIEGIPTEVVVVADDVALSGLVPPERRRGIAGTVLVHKIAGAAATGGKSLKEVAAIARSAASRLGTMGVALGSCIVPAAGKAGFTLGEDEIELGLGIHGEKGVERTKLLPADAITDRIVDQIAKDMKLVAGTKVALLVNGLGATPPMELAIVAGCALASLRSRGLAIERAWSGNFLTALEMPGCSISLLDLRPGDVELLDAATSASAWPRGGEIAQAPHIVRVPKTPENEAPLGDAGRFDPSELRRIGLAVCNALEEAEAHLTELDSKAGDGDLGASMLRGAEAIRALPDRAWINPANALVAIGNALRRAIAGSSGPFYAIALTRAGRHLGENNRFSPEDFRAAFAIGIAAISEIGSAKPGDRTMLDALDPALRALEATDGNVPAIEAWKRAAMAAADGARRTADMVPRLGRASYLGERALGTEDGGAAAVAIWMAALATSL